jgi:hypothetical protein
MRAWSYHDVSLLKADPQSIGPLLQTLLGGDPNGQVWPDTNSLLMNGGMR